MAFDGTYLWVGDFTSTNLRKILPATGQMVATYNIGESPFNLVFDGANIWSVNPSDSTVTKVAASSGQVIGTYPVGTNAFDEPENITFDGTYIWTSNLDTGDVTKVDPATGQAIGTYPVGTRPGAMTFDGTYLWICTPNGVVLINPANGSPINSLSITAGSLTFDGRNIWLVDSANHLLKIRADSQIVVQNLALTTSSNITQLLFDGTNVWAVDFRNNLVLKVNAATATLVEGYPVGQGSAYLAFDGSSLWVANRDAGTLTQIRSVK